MLITPKLYLVNDDNVDPTPGADLEREIAEATEAAKTRAFASIEPGPPCTCCGEQSRTCRCPDDPAFLIKLDRRRQASASRLAPLASGVVDPTHPRTGRAA